MTRKDLAKRTWQTTAYYQRIAQVDDLSHPALARIKELCRDCDSILDVGCGDGRKLAMLGNSTTKQVGLDVSPQAINLAKKNFPTADFVVGVGEHLPFPNAAFSAVVSTFVIEHTQVPEQVVAEMLRVVKKSGLIIILAPNFGAPNRASPNFSGSRAQKLITGLVNDFLGSGRHLSWHTVTPKTVTMEQFHSDEDTTVVSSSL